MNKKTLLESLGTKEDENFKNTLILKLAKGDLIAEGRYTDIDRFTEDIPPNPYEKIPREAWLDFEPNFQSNELIRHPIHGAEERYVHINILYGLEIHEEKNKGGASRLISQEKFNAEIAAYLMVASNAVDPFKSKNELDFKKHIKNIVPCIYKLINGEELNVMHKQTREAIPTPNKDGEEADLGDIPQGKDLPDRTKTINRYTKTFLEDYKAAYKTIDDIETNNT